MFVINAVVETSNLDVAAGARREGSLAPGSDS